jgi:hypothetical protein
VSAHQPPTQQLKENNFTRANGIVPRARLKAPLFFWVASKCGRCGAEQKCAIHTQRVRFGHGEVALLIQVKKMVKEGPLLLRVILHVVAPGQIMS